jgi:glycosyltransferase involved in cell wall biosynthesis
VSSPASASVLVVIPALNEARTIERCLHSIREQEYPVYLIRIVVVDGGSTDGTIDAVERMRHVDDRISWMPNPGIVQSIGMNIGVRDATETYICRIDAKAFVEPTYIAQCVELADRTGAGNVGGRREAVGHGAIQEGIAWAMSSPYGASEYAYSSVAGPVQSVYPGFFRRTVGEAVGWFDEAIGIHEDFDVNLRIRTTGATVYFDPAIKIYYTPRKTLAALAKQYFKYGRSKSSLARGGDGFLRLRNLIAPAFVVALLILVVASVLTGAWWLVSGFVAAYLLALAAVVGRGARQCGLSARLARMAALACMHVSWGSGFLTGLLRRSTYARR